MSVITAVTSRRSLLAGAVVATAFIPAASPAKGTHPDEALLAYGRELDRCAHDYWTICAKYRPLWDKLNARLEQERDSETNRASHSQIYDEVGLSALDQQGEHPDDIMARSDAPSRAILAIPATTLAGLAVKARLAKFGASHIWDESDADADWDHLVLRNLVNAVLELAAAQTEKPSPLLVGC
jgi:hypothetical protein